MLIHATPDPVGVGVETWGTRTPFKRRLPAVATGLVARIPTDAMAIATR
jgi:hypothetical protein